jgi:uncharacterized protein
VNSVFIIDTNVVVAGLLTSSADSPVAAILDDMLRGRFRFALSEALLAEYRGVLLRQKLMRLHQLTESEIDAILTTLARHAIVLSAPTQPNKLVAQDVGDQFLWDLLTSREDLILITGDKLLLQTGPLQPRVMTPLEFATRLLG